uniref:Rhodanese domain-containing protein n=1 Tax=Mantoniella antarctica TaxID=81844 RepID=A0A7S0SNR8_9CHLO|mmetsp:Transcript_32546/g.81963  ORF Transcript_32546/g.81963 Transcript_32546/m.81963 type:complete len:261 (+) Transcript_32546:245-1027(+)
MHVTNIGGSLTTAVCLSLIAWSIRVLRAAKLADQKSQKNPTTGGSLPSIRSNRRAFARLSPTAFWLLVQSKSIRAVLVDVRPAKEVEEAGEDEISKRLGMINIPVEELASVLRHKHTAWRARTHTPLPNLRATIVFVSTHGHSASTAASLAMSLGFQRCAVIEGGLAAAAPLAPPVRNSASAGAGAGAGSSSSSSSSSLSNTAAAAATTTTTRAWILLRGSCAMGAGTTTAWDQRHAAGVEAATATAAAAGRRRWRRART